MYWNIGDRVKDYLTLELGTIIEIDYTSTFPITVRLDCGITEYYFDRELIKVNL